MNGFLRLLRTLAALVPLVLASVAVAIGGLVLFRRLVPFEDLQPYNDVVGNYLQTLGTIYAVLLAFVVYMVWSQFNEARNYVEREAKETFDLFRIAQGFPDDVRRPLEEQLRAYVDAVLAGEWVAMAKCHDAPLRRSAAVLDEMWATLRRVEPRGEREAALYQDALARLNELGDLRTYRTTSSRQRIPQALWILLLMGALMTVGSVYLFGVASAAVHAFITGALAGAVSHILYVIADLDDCFEGHFRVAETPFQRVRDAMAAPGGAA